MYCQKITYLLLDTFSYFDSFLLYLYIKILIIQIVLIFNKPRTTHKFAFCTNKS